MTVTKRMGLTGLVVLTLSACVAYLAAILAIGERSTLDVTFNGLLLALVAGMMGVALLVFYRSVRQASRAMADQLDNMTRSGQIGLVMDNSGELSVIAKSINQFLTGVKSQTDRLRAESREMQIYSRIADAEKQHTEAIIFSISEAVIVTNRFDELVLANEAAEKLLGFRLAGSLRKNIDQVISDGTLVRLIRETRSGGQNAGRKIVEHSIEHKGLERTFSITLSCVLAPSQDVSGVVVVLHDVTREKEIGRMKTDFVSNVSHELKTPLASIKAYIEMLIDGEADDERTRNEFYETISIETDRLHRLIENILNISRIESGMVKVIREPVSLTAIAKQVLDVAAPQAKLNNINLIERLAPVCDQIEADRDMIFQAVLNLVSNAIKYTPAGGSVTVSVVTDERRNMAVCDVSDTGVGIPADNIGHVFDKFYRVEANKKIAKGTGLGLTLTKHIIETVHDGKLSVRSTEGKGSTFGFELPILT